MRKSSLLLLTLLLSSFVMQLATPDMMNGGATAGITAKRNPGIQYTKYMLSNANFSGDASSWTYDEWGTNPGSADGYYSTSNYHSSPGNVMVRLQYSSQQCEAGWTQPFTYTGTTPCDSATLTFWWRCIYYNSPGSTNFIEIYMECLKGSGNWIRVYRGDFYSTTSWAFVSVPLKSYIDTYKVGTYQFEADVYMTTGSYGTPQIRVQYDDVQIEVKYTVELPPTGLSVVINNGNTYTNNRLVTLGLLASGASYMDFKNETGGWTPWETFATTKQIYLTPGDGSKTVYFNASNGISPPPTPVTDTIIFDGSSPPTPSLQIPANNTATNNNAPQFTWSSVSDIGPSGLASYTLQYSTDITFATWVTTVPGLTGTSYTPSQLADGTWFWRVCAVDNAGNQGAYSSTNRFVVIDTVYPSPPELVSPSSGQATSDDTPTLTWNRAQDADPSSGVSNYTLQYSMDPLFSSGVYTLPGLAATYYTTSQLANGVWYWRVRTVDRAGNTGSYSGYWSTVIDTVLPGSPTLISPTNNTQTNDSTPTLVWDVATDPSPSSGVISYTLQYANNPSFTGATSVPGLAGTSYTFLSTLSDGFWYWRVRAVDRANNQGAYATYLRFLVDTQGPGTPNFVSPADGSSTNDNTPEFRWNTVTDSGSGVSSYVLELDTSPNFNTVNKTTITGLTGNYTLTTPLGDDVWYWHVRAFDGVGNAGSWETTPRSLTVDTKIPGAPTLVAPANALISSNKTQVFKWALVGADSYDLYIDNNPDITTPEYTYIGLTNDSKAVGNLGDGNWYWKVIAQRVGGSNSSTTWGIVIDTQAPSQPTHQSPPTGTYTNDNTPSLVWNPATDTTSGVASYTLQYANNPSFAGATSVPGLTGTSYTFSSALLDGIWYWRVMSIDRAGNAGIYSSNWSITLDTYPPTGLNMWATSGNYTNSLLVDLGISANGADMMSLSNDGMTWVEYAFSGTKMWMLTAGDGSKNVYLKCRDLAGNWANLPGGGYITLLLDTVPPAPGLPSIPAFGTLTSNNLTYFQWSAGSDSGSQISTYNLQYSQSPTFASGVITISGLAGTSYTVSSPIGDGTWYWRINATDKAGNRGYFSISSSFTIDTIKPGQPVLLGPIDGTTLNLASPIFTWGSISGAVRYHVQVASDLGFTQDLIQNATLPTTQFSPLSDNNATMIDGTWYWHVQAIDAAGNLGAYSTYRSLVVDRTPPNPTTLVSPGDSSWTNNPHPTLSWSPVPGASVYWVQYDRSNTFDTPDIRTKVNLTSLSYTSETTLFQGTWYWRVLSVDQAGNPSLYTSSRVLFEDQAPPSSPGLYSPTDSSLTNNKTQLLTWSATTDPTPPSSGIANYTLQLDRVNTFNSTDLKEQSGLTSTTFAIPAGWNLSDGRWYWRLNATDRVGNRGGYSSAWSFILDTIPPGKPTIRSPLEGATVTVATPILNWSTVLEASKYIIEIDDSAAFGNANGHLQHISGITATTYTPTVSLSNGVWYWRVAAVDAAGNVGNFSNPVSFTVNAQSGLSPMMIIIAGGGSSGALALAVLGYVMYRRAKVPFVIKKIDQSMKLIGRGESPPLVPMKTRAQIIDNIAQARIAILSKEKPEEVEKGKGKREELESEVEPEKAKPSSPEAGESTIDIIAKELGRIGTDGEASYVGEEAELIKREIERLEKSEEEKKKRKGA